MRIFNFKQIILLFSLLLPSFCCMASNTMFNDGNTTISIKKSYVQGSPKDYAIQATIDGHYLTVAFTNNIGHVTVEVSEVNGGESQVESTPTPNGVIFYIVDTGSYIVTFTFSDGDIYYGEFEVTD